MFLQANSSRNILILIKNENKIKYIFTDVRLMNLILIASEDYLEIDFEKIIVILIIILPFFRTQIDDNSLEIVKRLAEKASKHLALNIGISKITNDGFIKFLKLNNSSLQTTQKISVKIHT